MTLFSFSSYRVLCLIKSHNYSLSLFTFRGFTFPHSQKSKRENKIQLVKLHLHCRLKEIKIRNKNIICTSKLKRLKSMSIAMLYTISKQ